MQMIFVDDGSTDRSWAVIEQLAAEDSRVLGKTAGEAANMLAEGKPVSEVAGGKTFKDGANKVEMPAILIEPVAITQDNLNLVIDAGWITKEKACAGADAAKVAACK
mgnify:CR=1 FL=1